MAEEGAHLLEIVLLLRTSIATPCRRSCGFGSGPPIIRPYVLQRRQMFLPGRHHAADTPPPGPP
jgi:hypothetical protein